MRGWPDVVRLRPGTNHLDVGYLNSKYTESPLIYLIKAGRVERQVFSITTLPGHKYVMKFNSDGAKLAADGIWVEDLGTGEVVGGTVQKTKSNSGNVRSESTNCDPFRTKNARGKLFQYGDETVLINEVDGTTVGSAAKVGPTRLRFNKAITF